MLTINSYTNMISLCCALILIISLLVNLSVPNEELLGQRGRLPRS